MSGAPSTANCIGAGVPFSAMITSRDPVASSGAKLATRRLTESGRACVATMTDVFNLRIVFHGRGPLKSSARISTARLELES